MAPNKTLVFSKIPVGQPKVGEDLTYETREINLDEVPAGGLIVKIESVSLDPYMRGRMRDASIKSYSPAYTLGAPVDALALGKVVKSASPDYAEGDLVRGRFDIAEYTAFPGEHFEQRNVEKISNPHNLDLELFLGPLGMPGLTAWSSLFEIGKPKKGDTIFISSAAGAVGQTVAQIAKHEGLRVLGSVGSKDKLDYIINELGFDDGFDYKVEKPVEALARIAPEGIDIYFDNVGGEQLSAAITHMKEWGRIIACGAISSFSPEGPYPIKNMGQVVPKRIHMEGFIVGDPRFGPKYFAEHQETLQKWIKEGNFKAKLWVTEGIDKAGDAFVGMLRGENQGKAVVRF